MFQANKWCTEGVELLACQQIERCQAPEFAEEALRELEEFMASSDHSHLGSSRELKTMFEDVITPETKGLVQQVSNFSFFSLQISPPPPPPNIKVDRACPLAHLLVLEIMYACIVSSAFTLFTFCAVTSNAARSAYTRKYFAIYSVTLVVISVQNTRTVT